jgi:hypothetical protein
MADPVDTETVPVQVSVLGVEPVTGHGRLCGLAIVSVDTAGVVVTLQGVQVLRSTLGRLEVRSPCFRRPNGAWVSAILLPAELSAAIASEVVAYMGEVARGVR